MIIKKIKKTIEVSKAGKLYTRVLLQFEEYKDVKDNYIWISGFGNKSTWAWKEGDDVTPEITQKDKYYNFSFRDTDDNRLDVYSLPATVGVVIGLLEKLGNKAGKSEPKRGDTPSGGTTPVSDEVEINPEDIPF